MYAGQRCRKPVRLSLTRFSARSDIECYTTVVAVGVSNLRGWRINNPAPCCVCCCRRKLPSCMLIADEQEPSVNVYASALCGLAFELATTLAMVFRTRCSVSKLVDDISTSNAFEFKKPNRRLSALYTAK